MASTVPATARLPINRSAIPEGPMRAIVQDRYGSADVLHLAHIDLPTPAEHEVLLRVHAAGVARGTWHLMTGKPFAGRLAFGLRRPKNRVPGMDVAGTVVAVGASVTRFAQGDQVFGFGEGSFADYAVARENKLALKPSAITFEQAAGVPVSAGTALQAVTDIGRLKPGQNVLVIGASGAVGGYAVQLAKALGTNVTGVASTDKLDLVQSFGADHVIDYTQDDWADGSRGYDLILDIAGNPTLSRLRRALAPAGTVVIVGGENGGDLTGGMNRQLSALVLSRFVRQRLTMFIAKQRASDLERLTELIEVGMVTPRIDHTYPLEQAADAMRYVESGAVRGQVAITMGSRP
jgi:NADPH:quinone reductase-like Zn-dependent oxidoreductase